MTKPPASPPASGSPLLSRLLPPLLKTLAVFHMALFLLVFVLQTFQRKDKDRDLIIYYETAQRVNRGEPIYVSRPQYGPYDKPFDYLYPPPFAAAIAPLGRLDWPVFARVWTLILLVSWFGYGLCLIALADRRLGFWSFMLTNLAVGMVPGSHHAFSLGQIDPFLWLIFGLGVLAARRSKGSTGLFLSVAALVKIYSIFALPALRGRLARRSWAIAAATLGVGLLLGGWVCGFGSYADWFAAVPPVVGQGTFNPDNVSLSMAVLRLARWLGWHYPGGSLGGLPKIWLALAATAGPLTALVLMRKGAQDMRVALVGVAAAVCAPICWSSYLALLLAPLALWWGARGRQERLPDGNSVERP